MAIIVVLNLPAHGHTNPTLPVIAELVQQGERVVYYSLEEFCPAIQQTGAEFRSYGDAYPFDPSVSSENGFQVFIQFLQASELILEQHLSSIKALKPDLIIYDQLCFWGYYIAQILKVPTICSMTMFVISLLLLLSSKETLASSLTSFNEHRIIRTIARRISQRYQVKYLNILEMSNNPGQLNIVYTSSYFQPYSRSLNKSYVFVGPSIAPRYEELPFPFEKLQPEKKLIYISFGTIFNNHPEFYRYCIEAFEQSDYQVVMSIGSKLAPEHLGRVPENFLVLPRVPQLEILARTSLFISHGGMNSVSEALYYDKPLLVVPQATDQPWVARRVAQLGAGKQLSREAVNARSLRKNAAEVLANPAFALESARIGKTLREAGGYHYAADTIYQFVSSLPSSSRFL